MSTVGPPLFPRRLNVALAVTACWLARSSPRSRAGDARKPRANTTLSEEAAQATRPRSDSQPRPPRAFTGT